MTLGWSGDCLGTLARHLPRRTPATRPGAQEGETAEDFKVDKCLLADLPDRDGWGDWAAQVWSGLPERVDLLVRTTPKGPLAQDVTLTFELVPAVQALWPEMYHPNSIATYGPRPCSPYRLAAPRNIVVEYDRRWPFRPGLEQALVTHADVGEKTTVTVEPRGRVASRRSGEAIQRAHGEITQRLETRWGKERSELTFRVLYFTWLARRENYQYRVSGNVQREKEDLQTLLRLLAPHAASTPEGRAVLETLAPTWEGGIAHLFAAAEASVLA